MSISAKLKKLCSRVIRGVPPGAPGCLADEEDGPKYIAAHQLPDDPDTLVRAGIIQSWRRDASGESWYKTIDAAALEDWSPLDCPRAAAADDDEDFDDDDGYEPDDDFADDDWDDDDWEEDDDDD